jgi:copper chaperone NosL
MKAYLERGSRFLDRPLDIAPRALLVLAALLLLPAFLLPLWRVSVDVADSRSLVLELYADHWSLDGQATFLEEAERSPRPQPEAAAPNWYPFAMGAVGLLLLRAAVVGKIGSALDVTVLSAYLVLFSLWSFGYRAAAYGHNFFPGAEVSVAPLEGPLFGAASIGQVRIASHPAPGAWILLAVVVSTVAALLIAWRDGRRAERAEAGVAG